MKLYKTVNWLSAEKSLREQGITETTVVTLRKKYFFSDQNVDQNDFAQLNLLYAQVGVVVLYHLVVMVFIIITFLLRVLSRNCLLFRFYKNRICTLQIR